MTLARRSRVRPAGIEALRHAHLVAYRKIYFHVTLNDKMGSLHLRNCRRC